MDCALIVFVFWTLGIRVVPKMVRHLIFIWLCFSLTLLFAKSTNLHHDDTSKPNHYQNYLTCLALCGNLHTSKLNRTLLSGEQVTDWVKDDRFDGCDSFCQVREKFSVASKLESLPPADFDRLEVTCLERETLAPLKLRAKLNIPHQEDFPANESILFVVETWRSLAEEGGIIKNSLAGRYFTFSSQFLTPYRFTQSPNRENFYIRVFAFTADGPVGKPLCSSAVSPRSLLLNGLRKPLILGHVHPIRNNSHFLQWTLEDELAPPECDQFLQLIMAQKIQTKTVVLDASHLIPIGDLNENFTYQIKMSGLLAHQTNADADSTSMLIIGSLNDVEPEDWNMKLERYFGLLVTFCIVFLMILIMICFFCCRARRQRHPNYTPNTVFPKNVSQNVSNNSENQRDGQNEDTKTEETSIVVEQPSYIDSRYVPYEFPTYAKENYHGAGYQFQPRDESYKFSNRPRQLKTMFAPNVHTINGTSTPNLGAPTFMPLTPPSEDFV